MAAEAFGTECNLGNIAPDDVLSLETLRLGLRSDTVERFAHHGFASGAADRRGRLSAASPTPAADGRSALTGRPWTGSHGSCSRCWCSPASPRSSSRSGSSTRPPRCSSFELTPRFSPTPTGHIKAEQISFKLANAEPVTVTIIDAAGNTVATLVRDTGGSLQTVLAALERSCAAAARSYTVAAGPEGTHDRDARQRRSARARRRISRARVPARPGAVRDLAAELHADVRRD